MKRNYPHLWAMLAKLPGIPEENKERYVKDISKGRTIFLHEINDIEYSQLMIKLATDISNSKPKVTPRERQEKIRRLLKIDQDTYNMQMFEWSYEYLNHKFNCNELVNQYLKTHGYWIWWRNQFDLADGRFLSFYQAFNWEGRSLIELREAYRIMHIGIKAIPCNTVIRIEKLKVNTHDV